MGGWVKTGKMRGMVAGAALTAGIVAGLPLAAFSQTPSLTLITPPAERLGVAPMATSADGRVVTGFNVNGGATYGFTWTAEGGLNEFGSSPNVPLFTRVHGITSDGSTVVGERRLNTTEAFRYSNGTYSTLGALPPGANNSQAFGVSGNGSVIVGSIDDQFGFGKAMRWTPSTGMRDMGRARPEHAGGWFTGVSRDGSTAIGISGPGPSGAIFDAYTWTEADGWRLLPLPAAIPAATDVRPFGVNNDGTLVIGQVQPEQGLGRRTAVLWQDSQPLTLGTFGSDWNMLPRGLSDDGGVIVGFGTTTPDERTEPAIWFNGGNPIDFQTYIESLGLSVPAGWRLDSCSGVSPDGRTIIGSAQSLTQIGVYAGFVAVIPGQGVMACVGFAGVLVMGRRRR